MKTVLLLAALLAASAAEAQTYPAKPVTIVMGFPGGGSLDAALRPLAAKLAHRLGQPVVVENRPGAAGTLGASTVARAAPDGYVLLFGVAANLAVAPASMRQPPYDPTRAFTPVGEVAQGPYLWLVRADNPAHDMAGFIAWTKEHPGKVNYASPGRGTVHHLATEMLKRETGADMTHVPYKGGSVLATALLGGEVQAMIESPSAFVPLIRAGKVRALAVTGEHRLAALPDVPTLDEQGIHGLNVHSWWGLVGPAGMPAPIVARLNAALNEALREPDLRELYARLSATPTPGTPEAFGAHIAKEWRRWQGFVANSGLDLDD
jgi:tripartite-type tricarboxylate transporter receptor subunit TctC